MNILFLTMSPQLLKIEEHAIYNDLVRKFVLEGHEVYLMVPLERRTGKNTELYKHSGVNILGVKTLNVSHANVAEKGIGQLLLESQFKTAFKKYLSKVKFDLILYSTPPITFCKVIEYTKLINPLAKSYLMLKDIFPQNAVDLEMLSKTGIKRFVYNFFRKKEKQLYKLSDFIGCMSPANVKYVIKQNPEVNPSIVEICPNSYEVVKTNEITDIEKINIRKKYNLPTDRPIFIYGGNLGKPQGIHFLVDCMRANKDRKDCHFIIVGRGTDYPILNNFVKEEKPTAVSLFSFISKGDFDMLMDACDVGLIFLDHRFTIPNYPSRLLPYLMSKKPIVACTDPNCDMGAIAVENCYGLYCESNNVNVFTNTIDKILKHNLKEMGENGFQFYLNNYTVQHSYDAIMKHFNKV